MDNNTNLLSSLRIKQAVLGVLVLLAVFLLAKSINEFSNIGEPNMYAVQDMVTVTGKGEAFAVPDIATFSFSITEEGKDVGEANSKSSTKNNAVMKYLKDNGIAEKDIKTEGYNANPKYDYSQITCVRYPCPTQSPKLVGYEVSQTVSVKVRNADKAGEILSGVGNLGVTNISGLTFTVDDEEALKAEARTLAIEDAKAKAEKLAEDLGVKLGDISSFYEDMNPGYPMYAMESKAMNMGGSAAGVPDIAKGENKVTVNVNVSYRLK
jgi:uncharacterized protein YggE